MTDTPRNARTASVVNPSSEQAARIAEKLRSSGLSVTVFENAPSALAAWARCPPSLVVTALRMSGVDGWRLCRLLRSPEYAALNAVPILMLAEAYAREEAATIASDLGVDAFLSWPDDEDRLPEMAERLLRGEAVRPPLQALVVEDDPGMAELVRRSLAKQKYEVTVASRARDAVHAIDASPYDIVVIDYHLPDGRGDDLLDVIVARQPDCACIMVTGDMAPELAVDWMRRGAAAYLHKPFSMEYLVEICARSRREQALLRAEGLLHERSLALHASETKCREIIDQAPDMIFLHDMEGRFLDVNRAACAQTGYAKEELLRMRVTDLDPDAFARSDRQQIWGPPAHPEASPMTLLVRHRRKDGSLYPAEVIVSRVRIHGALCLLAVGRDISDRLRAERERDSLAEDAQQTRQALLGVAEGQKRAEEALDRERDLLRIVIDHLPDGVCLKDTHLRMRIVNRAHVRALGLSSEAEALGKTDADFFQPDTAAALMDADQVALAGGRAMLGREESFPFPDGTPREVLASRIPLFDGKGNVTGLVGIMRDITEHKELENQFRQAQKMESIGRLAGGIAHDFNNMLQSIFGNTELALESAEPDSLLREDLLEIRNAARRSAELTGKLLAFARRQSISPETMDLNEAIESTLPILGRLIGEDIELQLNPGEGLWPIRMDPSQLDQVLTNLAVNARDAIRGTGALMIETENFSVDAPFCETHIDAHEGDYVRVAISDTGSGMSRDVMSHIFEPFFTTKEKGKGTGLGLSTVYGIVHQSGGFIHAYSEVGLGTTFQLFLPRSHDAPVDAEGPEETDPIGGTETVLVVEDEAAILRLAQRILENFGYTVLSAASPGEALNLAKTHPDTIHLLLTDVIMPVMNGRELADKIEPLRPGIRIVFMSGYTADVLGREGALGKGMFFLAKPFSSRTLAAHIRRALDVQGPLRRT